MITLEEYLDGTHGNSKTALAYLPKHAELLRTVNEAFEKVLPYLGSTHEGAVIFAAMSHAAYLAALQLATSGQLPPTCMVARGCIEDAIYAFYLFYHPELKGVWSNRQDGPEAKKKVRDEFTIGKMKAFLRTKNAELATKFTVIYEATIDQGAHPNAFALYSHLVELETGDFEWKYINTSNLDRNFAIRLVASAGVWALKIFQELFPINFLSTGTSELIDRAIQLVDHLPEPQEDAAADAAGA